MPAPICETVIVIAYATTRECARLHLGRVEVWNRVMDNRWPVGLPMQTQGKAGAVSPIIS
jgi:hypothetical protein